MNRPLPWLRVYTDAYRHPKLIRLSDKVHRFWFGCLCLAGEHGGILPSSDDIALHLRVHEHHLEGYTRALIEAGLIDETPNGLVMHNWAERQHRDLSTQRVREFRKRRETVSSAFHRVSETNGNASRVEENREEKEETCAAGAANIFELSITPPLKHGPGWFDEQHERWYLQYWCKRAKQSSRKAFEKRIKQLVSSGKTHEGSVEFLIERVQFDRSRFEGFTEWDFRGGLYPATWLNGERWNDDGPRIIKPSRQERRAGCPPCPACGCNPCAPNCRAAALAVAR